MASSQEPERKSCGAIFYAFNPNGQLGIILGTEARTVVESWLPFKGGCHENETHEETAIREIYEETGGLVQLDSINLYHKFSTKRKIYHIGICEVPYDIIEKFDKLRSSETRAEFLEKKQLGFFLYPDVLKDPAVHNISRASILFYKNFLDNIKANNKKNIKNVIGLRSRYLGIQSETPMFKLSRPRQFNASYTPNSERVIENARIWRRVEPLYA